MGVINNAIIETIFRNTGNKVTKSGRVTPLVPLNL